jgi:hypothetical protein
MATFLWARGVAGAAMAACAGGVVAQQYSTGFEPPGFTGSPTGTSIAGQSGWYTPAQAIDAAIFTYAGNAPGFTPAPGGGAQLLITSPGPIEPARAERAEMFPGMGVITFTVDLNLIVVGQIAPPLESPISSFSLQPLNSRYFVATNRWADPGDPNAGWNAAYFVAPSGPGTVVNVAEPLIPGPQWMNLHLNHWYRQSTTVDFDANRITAVSITDLATNQSTTVAPTDYYLNGGSDPTGFDLPAAVRFSGNNYPQINMGWDNFHYEPTQSVPPCYPNCDGSTNVPFLNVNDFVCFQQKFAAGDSYANCDHSTSPPVLNVNDFICFQQSFAAGCSAP